MIIHADNNNCGNNYYPNNWDFGTWDNWAKTTSPNKNIKIYIGALASQTSYDSGYVDINTFTNIIKTNKAQYSSFGGVMLWDETRAWSTHLPFIRRVVLDIDLWAQ